MKNYNSLALCLAATACLSPVYAANIVPNGDFSAGNTGFTSDYSAVVVLNSMSLFTEETYAIENNPADGHFLWQPIPAGNPYNTVNGDMMIVNGAQAANQIVWATAAPISISSGQTYFFESYVTNLSPPDAVSVAPAILSFEYSYNNITWFNLTTLNLSNTVSGVWQLGGGSFAATAGQVSLRLTNQQTAATGNDFAIGLVSLDLQAVPEPSSALLGAFGALALLRRRR
ncbi:MAG: PEP-CTERM sorting domain-containing protein [Akkermansiaceae bacterium]|nr:PEP-CTERM sorting domain-containing protein [Akkermansiaceae bacterium]